MTDPNIIQALETIAENIDSLGWGFVFIEIMLLVIVVSIATHK